MPIGTHRHVLTPRVFEALACRASAPRVRRGENGWRLEVGHEAGAAVRLESGDDALAALRAEGLRSGMVSLAPGTRAAGGRPLPAAVPPDDRAGHAGGNGVPFVHPGPAVAGDWRPALTA